MSGPIHGGGRNMTSRVFKAVGTTVVPTVTCPYQIAAESMWQQVQKFTIDGPYLGAASYATPLKVHPLAALFDDVSPAAIGFGADRSVVVMCSVMVARSER